MLSLVVIGGGVLEYDEAGFLVGKATVVQYMHRLSNFFAQTSWVTTYTGSRLMHSRLDISRVTPYLVRSKATSLLTDYFTLRCLAEQQSAILLHLPNPWLALPALALRHRCGKFVVYVAGDYIQYAQLARKQRGWLYAYLYRKSHEVPMHLADGVIVRGTKLRHYAEALNSNVIETVPISLNAPHNRVSRRREPCASEHLRILYVGKVTYEKGVDLLLHAFVSLRREFPQRLLTLTVVGSGTQFSTLQKLASDLKLDSCVQFLGYIDDMKQLREFYADADLLVVPSTSSEGVPRVIEEAIIYGIPVIASATGGIPEEFQGGEVVLVPPGDEKALTTAMRQVICDTRLRTNLLEAACMRAKYRAAQSSAAEQHAQFIMGTLGWGKK